jgi:hypothetical protein
MCSRSWSTRPARDALGCSSLPGAGAKQERRLFRELPELLSTAANRPVMGRGFSVSAGQQMVWITLGVKWEHTVRSRGRSRCSEPLRSRSVTQSTDTRAVMRPYPGFRVSFWFRLVGMGGAAAGDHEGEPRSHWPRTRWLTTVTSPAVGLECAFLIFMVGQRLT